MEAFGVVDGRGRQLWLVVRRHRGRPDERAYFFARGPAATRPDELIRVAGTRWRVEKSQADNPLKQEVGRHPADRLPST